MFLWIINIHIHVIDSIDKEYKIHGNDTALLEWTVMTEISKTTYIERVFIQDTGNMKYEIRF